jgi:hypothetical protein
MCIVAVQRGGDTLFPKSCASMFLHTGGRHFTVLEGAAPSYDTYHLCHLHPELNPYQHSRLLVSGPHVC